MFRDVVLRFIKPMTLTMAVQADVVRDGAEKGATDLSNRGHDDWPEITCWPGHRATLTTGREFKKLGVIAPRPDLDANEKQICKILGLEEWELDTFLRSWSRGDKHRPDTRSKIGAELNFVVKGRRSP